MSQHLSKFIAATSFAALMSIASINNVAQAGDVELLGSSDTEAVYIDAQSLVLSAGIELDYAAPAGDGAPGGSKSLKSDVVENANLRFIAYGAERKQGEDGKWQLTGKLFGYRSQYTFMRQRGYLAGGWTSNEGISEKTRENAKSVTRIRPTSAEKDSKTVAMYSLPMNIYLSNSGTVRVLSLLIVSINPDSGVLTSKIVPAAALLPGGRSAINLGTVAAPTMNSNNAIFVHAYAIGELIRDNSNHGVMIPSEVIVWMDSGQMTPRYRGTAIALDETAKKELMQYADYTTQTANSGQVLEDKYYDRLLAIATSLGQ